MHVDARDFIRGTRPWAQFWNFCVKIAHTDGSDLWAAQLRDERYIPAVIARLRAGGNKPARPALEGYTVLVRAIYMLANEIRLLINSQGRGTVEFLQGPETIVDRIRAQDVARGLEIVDAALD